MSPHPITEATGALDGLLDDQLWDIQGGFRPKLPCPFGFALRGGVMSRHVLWGRLDVCSRVELAALKKDRNEQKLLHATPGQAADRRATGDAWGWGLHGVGQSRRGSHHLKLGGRVRQDADPDVDGSHGPVAARAAGRRSTSEPVTHTMPQIRKAAVVPSVLARQPASRLPSGPMPKKASV